MEANLDKLRNTKTNNSGSHVAVHGTRVSADSSGSGCKNRGKISRFDTMIENQLKQGKRVSGSRKNQININHLLEFDGGYVRERQPKKFKQKIIKSNNQNDKIHLYGIDFINLNYKFIVNCDCDMKLQQLDPNVPVEIENIIRVIAHKGNSCPICLTDEIVAPRMITSCGHILCLKCLLNLLDSELPKAQKRESSAIIEKYKECPLCQSIIRKSEILPVLIDNIDERFEIPKIHDEINLTLMTRSSNRILPLPKSLQLDHFIDDFPWYNGELDLSSYARIFKGDLPLVLSFYNQEKQQLLKQYEDEKLLYNEDSKFYDMTLKYIDDEIKNWQQNFNKNEVTTNGKSRKNSHGSRRNSNDHDLNQVFHFYQTGFNTNCVYVLAPLDMKVLKTTYGSYENLPSSIIVQIENIKYEELSSENSITKYKYLSHLPLGTQLGFLECNWYGNGFISPETWKSFEIDLTKRSKYLLKKSRREENDRKRALIHDEIKTREFYAKANADEYDDSETGYPIGVMGSLSIVDNRDLPSLTKANVSSMQPVEPAAGFETTIWGTQIPKHEKPEPSPSEEEEDWEAEEMIRRAKEEINKMAGVKGKKKKKINLFST